MTFDEFKDYTKAALELAGDTSPEVKAAIVIAAMNKHVMMPSDVAQMERQHRDWQGGGAIAGMARGNPVGAGAALGVRADQLVPPGANRIG